MKIVEAKKQPRRLSTLEVCQVFDISKATLFRWERAGMISTPPRDWRNWRLYTETNLDEIKRMIKKRTSGEA